ncbi:FN3 associated domain-containing protein, partial [Segetibacter sp.]|uniref:FN3 associated domain-containing protein n=1 Tax=Segetibacter sp. TaxID=2231182 RepID=UPI00262C892C
NTGITKPALAAINKRGKIRFETGFDADKVVMKLTPPIVVNGDSIVSQPVAVQLKHYVPGTTIRYTTDGTDPDSTTSPVYNNDLQIQKIFELKTRAVKSGWYSSDVISRYFFTTRYRPDSIALLKPADAKYKAKEGKTLADLIKSEPSKGTGKWLGFQNNNFEGLLIFKDPVKASSVTLSLLRDIGASIFPPTSIEIYGGPDRNKLSLLGKVFPKQPIKGDPNTNLPITCEFSPRDLQFIKIVATPLAKIPEWHGEKGKKGWVFIDEVMVN